MSQNYRLTGGVGTTDSGAMAGLVPTFGSSRVTAVLGPTNTGKTHFAVERMLGHASGIIGLPLRLLAREVYDKVVARAGARQVALITGEEKIIPNDPAYFVCTVESMPMDRRVHFLAVDEIQLAADPERGHVFTDRILHARGTEETVFIGADSVRPLLKRLVPEAEYVARPRFSRLTYAGFKKMSRLPPRSAVVAYSAAEVYAIAEFLRRQRGGAAVVMGALSPRTRNAQVAMFENGEVDYLVATDAIGMGLNLDIAHVAFASMRKFDGRFQRPLSAAEVGQVAGRAGRYMTDGTFGTTGEVGPLDPDLVERVESHRYDILRKFIYRNSNLDYSSVPGLITSLETPPRLDCLLPAGEAEDLFALKSLYREGDIAQTARSPANVRLLWEVCRVPDFRKTMADAHVRLLGEIYRHLIGPGARIERDWMAAQIERLDRTVGDIDTLATRLSFIRTWTYVSHHGDWVDDPLHWQGRTRAIEDRLSDALHERLTQRFVDRRTSALNRRLKDAAEMIATVETDGAVTVEGHAVGHLRGFRFVSEKSTGALEQKALRTAANRALQQEIARRASDVAHADTLDIGLDQTGRLLWKEQPVAQLVAGPSPLQPKINLLHSELLAGKARAAVEDTLRRWVKSEINRTLNPLVRLNRLNLTGAAGGIAFRMEEKLGHVGRGEVTELLAAVSAKDRKRLRQAGVLIGRAFLYMPALLKPARSQFALLLWAVHEGLPVPALPAAGRVSFETEGLPPAACVVAGYTLQGRRAIRIDMYERLATTAAELALAGAFPCTPALLSLVGARRDEFPAIIRALGYRSLAKTVEGEALYSPKRSRNPKHRRAADVPPAAQEPVRSRPAVDPRSPFAALGQLRVAGQKGSQR